MESLNVHNAFIVTRQCHSLITQLDSGGTFRATIPCHTSRIHTKLGLIRRRLSLSLGDSEGKIASSEHATHGQVILSAR
jgi:hypothetical protein